MVIQLNESQIQKGIIMTEVTKGMCCEGGQTVIKIMVNNCCKCCCGHNCEEPEKPELTCPSVPTCPPVTPKPTQYPTTPMPTFTDEATMPY